MAITKKSVEENAKDMLNEYEEETSTHEDSSNAVESFISAVESKDKNIDINKCLIFVKK